MEVKTAQMVNAIYETETQIQIDLNPEKHDLGLDERLFPVIIRTERHSIIKERNNEIHITRVAGHAGRQRQSTAGYKEPR